MAGRITIEKKMEGLENTILQYKTKMMALKHYCQEMKCAAQDFREQALQTRGVAQSYVSGKAAAIEEFVKVIEDDIL